MLQFVLILYIPINDDFWYIFLFCYDIFTQLLFNSVLIVFLFNYFIYHHHILSFVNFIFNWKSNICDYPKFGPGGVPMISNFRFYKVEHYKYSISKVFPKEFLKFLHSNLTSGLKFYNAIQILWKLTKE